MIEMLYLYLFLLSVLLVYLVFSLLGKTEWGKSPRKVKEASSTETYKTCPICRHLLKRGERIRSIVFRGGVEASEVREKACHIFGCPYCYPPNRENPRYCPVCNRKLDPQGYLVARLFQRKGRKRDHLHILGCTECRKNRKRNKP